MSPEVAQETNELDIDDGTAPVEDVAQTEEVTEETAQIDDDGDVDGSQVSEVETSEDAEPDAEPATEEADDKTEEAPKAEAKPAAEPVKSEPNDYTQAISQFREEFGETAAKPFEQLAKRTERLEAALGQVLAERDEHAKRSDRQIADQHMTSAGIEAKNFDATYQDAVDYFRLRQQQGKPVSGMDALQWAMRGATRKPAPSNSTSTRAEQAAKLQRIRSVPPKGQRATPALDLDDPAVADGTAPRRS